MSDFGDTGYATLEPKAARMELISFTGITGTTLTGVTRGLQFKAPYTADASLQKPHGAGRAVVFSNSPQFIANFANKDNDETITETYTYSSANIPRLDSYVAPTLDEEFVSKKYVDDTALAGAPDATETVKGVVELATPAELAAGTPTGGTGANLVPHAEDFNDTSSATTLVPVTGSDGKLDQGFIDLTENFVFEGEVDVDTATNFKLGGTAYTGTMADLNEASDFFQTTDITGAEAETLSDASEATGLHYHDAIELLKAQQATDYINAPFFVAANEDGTLTNFQASESQGSVRVAAALTQFSLDASSNNRNAGIISGQATEDGSDSFSVQPIVTSLGLLNLSDRWRMNFSVLKQDSVGNFYVALMGSNTISDIDGNTAKVGIRYDGTNLQATVSDGTTTTNTTIASSAVGNVYNVLIERDASDIKFYVDGVLEHTQSTDLPSSGGLFAVARLFADSSSSASSSALVSSDFGFWFNKNDI